MSTYDLIHEAIENKMQVTATYHGYYREMCPHALGMKNGVIHGHFYQFGGESSSRAIVPGSPQNWRCLVIDELEDVSIRPGAWHTANNHSRPSTCIDHIDIEVDL